MRDVEKHISKLKAAVGDNEDHSLIKENLDKLRLQHDIYERELL